MLGFVTAEEEARLFSALQRRRAEPGARIDPSLGPAAGRHGIDGLLGEGDPAWQARVDAVRFGALTYGALTARLSGSLRAAGLRHVILKGVVAAAAWPRPELRPQTDVDLLVAPTDVPAAIEALVSDGLVEAGVRRAWQHATPLRARGLMTSVDLHDSTGTTSRLGASTERLLGRAVVIQTSVGPLPSLAPDDALLFLASHAGRHLLERIAWLVDLAGLVSSGAPDPGVVAARAEALGVVVVTAFALEAAARGLGDPRLARLAAALGVPAWRLAGLRWLRDRALSERAPGRRRAATLAARMALVDGPAELPAWLARKWARRRGERAELD